jgi:hypothetical protein
MSFKDFKEELLMAIAITTEGKPTVQMEAMEVAQLRNLTFREGWLRQAVKSLEDLGHISVAMFMGGGENLGMRVRITGKGLEEAEELFEKAGFDLDEAIDEYAAEKNGTPPSVIPAADRIVRIDHNSRQYDEVKDKIETVENAARMNNSLNSNHSDELGQRLAEIEAGKKLLAAPLTNTTLIKSLLFPALKWIGEKIADNIIAAIIAPLLLVLLTLLGM